jgi:4-carboxymuconolactone decarboxylase
MRFAILCAGAAGLLMVAQAQAPTPAEIHLRGDRFQPLTYAEMTPAQKAMIQHLLAGERHGSTDGPFNVMLRSPEIGDMLQSFGAQVRFHSELPPKLRELAIITTARYWTVQFEWSAHRRGAQAAGLPQPVIDAIAAGKHPTGLDPDESAVYNFTSELLKTKQVSDPVFHEAVTRLGERRLVNLMALVGYYQIVAMMLNVDRYPMPQGRAPELQPLP